MAIEKENSKSSFELLASYNGTMSYWGKRERLNEKGSLGYQHFSCCRSTTSPFHLPSPTDQEDIETDIHASRRQLCNSEAIQEASIADVCPQLGFGPARKSFYTEERCGPRSRHCFGNWQLQSFFPQPGHLYTIREHLKHPISLQIWLPSLSNIMPAST